MTSVHVDDLGARAVPTLLVAVLLAAVAAGCGGGGGEDSAAPGDAASSRRPHVEQPAADDPEAVQPILEDLLEQHDEIVNEVLADPSVARDEDAPLVEEYLSLYGPDSPVPEQVMESWVRDAEAGRSTQPAEPGQEAVTSRIDGEVLTVGPDEVRFPTCNELRYATYDGDGNLLDMVPYLEQPGEATVIRVEGRWVFQQLDSFQGQASCATEATTEEPS